MKYLFFAVLLSFGISSIAQDTTHSPGRSSISITGGANRTAALTSFGYYGPWQSPIVPCTTVSACFDVDYGYSLLSSKVLSLGLKLGVGYATNDYVGLGAWEVAYTDVLDLEKLSTIDIITGINAGIGRPNGLQWYNEVDLVGSVQTQMTFHGASFWLTKSDFTSDRNVNLYLYCYSGIKFPVGKRICITPMVGYSLFNITSLFNHGNVYDIDYYHYLRGDLMLTYKF